jgi:hypothetical protein
MAFPKPTDPYFRQERWLSVYGAFVAQQVQQCIIEGRGAPDEKAMQGYVEEAITVADMAEEAFEKVRE